MVKERWREKGKGLRLTVKEAVWTDCLAPLFVVIFFRRLLRFSGGECCDS